MIPRCLARLTAASLAALSLVACEDATRPLTPSPRSVSPTLAIDPNAVIDQQNLAVSGPTFVSGLTVFGQSFTAQLTGNLGRISFQVQCVTGVTADAYLMVYQGSWNIGNGVGSAFDASAISNTKLPSSTFTPCAPSQAPVWIDVDIDPVLVRAGQVYTFKLMAFSGTMQLWHPGNNTNAYGGGATYANAAVDLAFKTWVVPVSLDQQNLDATTSATVPASSFGQSFTAAITGQLKMISLQVNCGTNISGAVIQVYRGNIGAGNSVDIGFQPTPLTSESIDGSAWPTCGTTSSPTWVDIFLQGDVNIEAGQAYTFRLVSHIPGAEVQHPVSDANPYAGGSTFANAAHDAVFKTFVLPGSVSTTTDDTPPTITPVITGVTYFSGWYITNVGVKWTIVENESYVTASSGCVGTTLTTDTDANGVTFTCDVTTEGGNASRSVTIKRDATAPSLNPAVTPNPVVRNGVAAASAGATDLGSGIKTQQCDPVVTTSLGPQVVTCRATDHAGNGTFVDVLYTVVEPAPTFAFSGFFAPVDAAPTINTTKAGSAVPVKFSLGGNMGLGIMAANFPASQVMSCTSSAPTDDLEETVSAGGSSLSYDPIANRYTYVWKTDKAWAGTCRKLTVRLSDGTEHIALFKFSK